MMAVTARQMGYRIVVLDPSARCPTAQVADGVVVGALDDLEARAPPRAPGRRDHARHRARPGRPPRRARDDRAGAAGRERAAHDPGPAGPEAVPRSDRDAAGGVGAGRGRRPSSTRRSRRSVARRSSRSGAPATTARARSGSSPRPTRPRSSLALRGEPAVAEEVVQFAREISVILARGLDRRDRDLSDRRERPPPAHPPHHARAGADGRGAARPRRGRSRSRSPRRSATSA